MSIKKLFTFVTRFRKGLRIRDKFSILFYTILHILLYPINSLAFLLIRKNLIPAKIFFNNYIIENSDGLFFCRDNVDLDVVGEDFEHGIRNYFKSFDRGIFVDIGANIGKYTIMISNQLKEGKVISIEPHPENFKTLKKNIKLNNCKNIIPVETACWNKKEVLKLFNHEDQPLLSSSIKPSKSYIKINSDALDNILQKLNIKKVDFIKIDVEGAESRVLEGMKKILKSGKTKIIFEAWDKNYLNACREILQKYNYKIKHLDKMYWMGFHE